MRISTLICNIAYWVLAGRVLVLVFTDLFSHWHLRQKIQNASDIWLSTWLKYMHFQFLPRDALYSSALCAVTTMCVLPSVRPSIRHMRDLHVCRNGGTLLSNRFHCLVAQPLLFYASQRNFDKATFAGCIKYRVDEKNPRFWTSICLSVSQKLCRLRHGRPTVWPIVLY